MDVIRLLVVGPVPPPVTGQSVATKGLLEHLHTRSDFKVGVVNTSKRSFAMGVFTVARFVALLRIVLCVRRLRREFDLLYLSLSQSFGGNLRDLAILRMWKPKRFVVHLHGGGIGQNLFQRRRIARLLNRRAYRREALGAAIVLSPSLGTNFSGIVPAKKICSVPNYCDADLLVPERRVVEKQSSAGPLTVLYLSNMIPSKGYKRLAQSYKLLPQETQARVRMVFAGRFEDERGEREFIRRYCRPGSIEYRGTVLAQEKARLLAESHIFALPTFYPPEGQPISMLEAYAAGQVVLTTYHGGIKDIFRHGKNGLVLHRADSKDIAEAIDEIAGPQGQQFRVDVGLHNRRIAEESYSKEVHMDHMVSIFKHAVESESCIYGPSRLSMTDVVGRR